jgi:hypothetical protein
VQHHVRVQQGEQRFEIAAARRGQERFDDLAPPGQVRVRCGTAPDAAAGTARELPGAAGVLPITGAISSNGTANMSCSTNATRSAGPSASSTTSSASPTESASSASSPGSRRSSSGSGWVSRGSSGWLRRVRSRDRHTRATTVVSHAPTFSISPAPVRWNRSHASWTASSASAAEPSIR